MGESVNFKSNHAYGESKSRLTGDAPTSRKNALDTFLTLNEFLESKFAGSNHKTPTVDATAMGYKHGIDPGLLINVEKNADQFIIAKTAQTIYGENAEDIFGWSSDISEDGLTLAVGSIFNDGSYTNAGSVRVYSRLDEQEAWVQKGVDIDGEAAQDYSGWSIALSSDGDRIVVGAVFNDDGVNVNSGHVRVYDWDSGTSQWVQKGDDIDGGSAGDFFGYSISLSKDKNYIAVGAPYGENSYGYASVYYWNSGTSQWQRISYTIPGGSKGDLFGKRVALSEDGSRLVVSSPDAFSQVGLIYLYSVDQVSDTITLLNSKLGRIRFSRFGNSLDLKLNTLVVSVTGKITPSIVTYDISSDTFYENPDSLITLTNRYDINLKLSYDGNSLIYGMSGFNSDDNVINSKFTRGIFGHVKVYKLQDNKWKPRGWTMNPIGGRINDEYGKSVSISGDGGIITISNPYKDTQSLNIGSVSTFTVKPISHYVTPTITLTGPNPYPLQANTTYVEPGALTDTGATVTIIGEVENNTIEGGNYNISYTSQNGFGNVVTKTRQIVVTKDPAIPTMVLNGDAIMLLPVGGIFNDPGVTPNVLSTITVDSSQLNVNTPGEYIIKYNAVSSYGISSTQTITRSVVVVYETEYIGSGVTGKTTYMSRNGYMIGKGDFSENSVLFYEWGISTNDWKQIGQKLQGPANSSFGAKVALSSDGLTTVIGAPIYNQSTGLVRVYSYDFMIDRWTQKGGDIIDGYVGDNIGEIVTISGDGNVVTCGSSQPSGLKNPYVFTYKYTPASDTWVKIHEYVEPVKLGNDVVKKQFSCSLNTDGTMVLIGAPLNNYTTGAVFIYNTSDGSEIFSDYGQETGNYHGESVDISSDGRKIVIGSNFLKIYHRNQTTDIWYQVGNPIPFGCSSVKMSKNGETVTFSTLSIGGYSKVYQYGWDGYFWLPTTNEFSDYASGSLFGRMLFVTEDASKIFVESNLTNQLYRWNIPRAIYSLNGNRILRTQIDQVYNYDYVTTSSDVVVTGTVDTSITNEYIIKYTITENGLSDVVYHIVSVSGELLQLGLTIRSFDTANKTGWSTSISGNGNYLAVGIPGYDTNRGSVKIYQLNPGNVTWDEMISMNGPTPGGSYGYAISISSDGSRLAVGAPDTGNGIVYVYEYNGTWNIVGSPINGSSVDDKFGLSVSVNGDGTYVTVGEPRRSFSVNTGVGGVKTYQFTGSSWSVVSNLSFDNNQIEHQLGYDVAISSSNNVVVFGAPTAGPGYVKITSYISGLVPVFAQPITFGERFGWCVSISDDGSLFAVGAPFYSNKRGRVLVYNANTTPPSLKGSPIIGGNENDELGSSMHLSGNGEKLMIYTKKGRVSNFHFIDSQWVVIPGEIITSLLNDINFGYSLSSSTSGVRMVISAPLFEDNSGMVQVFSTETGQITQADFLAPTITLNGPAIHIHEKDTSYNEQGILRDDSETSFIVSGTVDANTPGSYTLTYSAQDTAGNISTTLDKVVTVLDPSNELNKLALIPSPNNRFRNSMVSMAGKRVATCTGLVKYNGVVEVYDVSDDVKPPVRNQVGQIITEAGDSFGAYVSLSQDGNNLCVTSILDSNLGRIAMYSLDDATHSYAPQPFGRTENSDANNLNNKFDIPGASQNVNHMTDVYWNDNINLFGLSTVAADEEGYTLFKFKNFDMSNDGKYIVIGKPMFGSSVSMYKYSEELIQTDSFIQFGQTVSGSFIESFAVSDVGHRLITQEDVGRVLIYNESPNGWSQEFQYENTVQGKVALSGDGNTAAFVSKSAQDFDPITLLGDSVISHPWGESFSDPGYSYSGAGSVTVTGTVNVSNVGENIITYDSPTNRQVRIVRVENEISGNIGSFTNSYSTTNIPYGPSFAGWAGTWRNKDFPLFTVPLNAGALPNETLELSITLNGIIPVSGNWQYMSIQVYTDNGFSSSIDFTSNGSGQGESYTYSGSVYTNKLRTTTTISSGSLNAGDLVRGRLRLYNTFFRTFNVDVSISYNSIVQLTNIPIPVVKLLGFSENTINTQEPFTDPGVISSDVISIVDEPSFPQTTSSRKAIIYRASNSFGVYAYAVRYVSIQNREQVVMYQRSNDAWYKFSNSIDIPIALSGYSFGGITLSNDGKRVAFSKHDKNFIYEYSIDAYPPTWKKIGEIPVSAGGGMALSGDGNRIVIGDPDGACVHVYDYSNTIWQLHTQIPLDPYSIDVSQNGEYIIIGSSGCIHVYELITGTFTIKGGIINNSALIADKVSISSDGTKFITTKVKSVGIGKFAYYEFDSGLWSEYSPNWASSGSSEEAAGLIDLHITGNGINLMLLYPTAFKIRRTQITTVATGWVKLGSDITLASITSPGSDTHPTPGPGTRYSPGNITGTTLNFVKNMGYAVEISDDGTVVAIGMPFVELSTTSGINSRGAVVVFAWDQTQTNWVQMGGLIVPKYVNRDWLTTNQNLEAESRTYSGASISLSADGQYLCVGSPGYIPDQADKAISTGTSENWGTPRYMHSLPPEEGLTSWTLYKFNSLYAPTNDHYSVGWEPVTTKYSEMSKSFYDNGIFDKRELIGHNVKVSNDGSFVVYDTRTDGIKIEAAGVTNTTLSATILTLDSTPLGPTTASPITNLPTTGPLADTLILHKHSPLSYTPNTATNLGTNWAISVSTSNVYTPSAPYSYFSPSNKDLAFASHRGETNFGFGDILSTSSDCKFMVTRRHTWGEFASAGVNETQLNGNPNGIDPTNFLTDKKSFSEVYVYYRDSPNDSWTQRGGTLSASSYTGSINEGLVFSMENFGSEAYISDDGLTLLISNFIGVPSDYAVVQSGARTSVAHERWETNQPLDEMNDFGNAVYAYKFRGGQWVPIDHEAPSSTVYTYPPAELQFSIDQYIPYPPITYINRNNEGADHTVAPYPIFPGYIDYMLSTSYGGGLDLNDGHQLERVQRTQRSKNNLDYTSQFARSISLSGDGDIIAICEPNWNPINDVNDYGSPTASNSYTNLKRRIHSFFLQSTVEDGIGSDDTYANGVSYWTPAFGHVGGLDQTTSTDYLSMETPSRLALGLAAAVRPRDCGRVIFLKYNRSTGKYGLDISLPPFYSIQLLNHTEDSVRLERHNNGMSKGFQYTIFKCKLNSSGNQVTFFASHPQDLLESAPGYVTQSAGVFTFELTSLDSTDTARLQDETLPFWVQPWTQKWQIKGSPILTSGLNQPNTRLYFHGDTSIEYSGYNWIGNPGVSYTTPTPASNELPWVQVIGNQSSSTSVGIRGSSRDSGSTIFSVGYYNLGGSQPYNSSIVYSNYNAYTLIVLANDYNNSYNSVYDTQNFFNNGMNEESMKCGISRPKFSGDIWITATRSPYGSASFTTTNNTTVNLPGVNTETALIVHYDSTGKMLWLSEIDTGGPGFSYGNGLVYTSSNVYVTGKYKSQVNVDVQLDINSPTVLPHFTGVCRMYVVNYDEGTGYPIWAFTPTSGSMSVGNHIECDSSGNVFITGKYSGGCTLSAGISLPTSMTERAFIVKLNSSGTVQWASTIGYTDASNIDASTSEGTSLDIDPTTGAICFTGSYTSVGSFIVGWDAASNPVSLPQTGTEPHSFVIKFTASGGNIVWATSVETESKGCGISIDQVTNSISVCGQYQGKSNSNNNYVLVGNLALPTIKTVTPHNAGFTLKLDSSGTGLWAHGLNTGYDTTLFTVVTVPNYGIFSGGYYQHSGATSTRRVIDPYNNTVLPETFENGSLIIKYNPGGPIGNSSSLPAFYSGDRRHERMGNILGSLENYEGSVLSKRRYVNTWRTDTASSLNWDDTLNTGQHPLGLDVYENGRIVLFRNSTDVQLFFNGRNQTDTLFRIGSTPTLVMAKYAPKSKTLVVTSYIRSGSTHTRFVLNICRINQSFEALNGNYNKVESIYGPLLSVGGVYPPKLINANDDVIVETSLHSGYVTPGYSLAVNEDATVILFSSSLDWIGVNTSPLVGLQGMDQIHTVEMALNYQATNQWGTQTYIASDVTSYLNNLVTSSGQIVPIHNLGKMSSHSGNYTYDWDTPDGSGKGGYVSAFWPYSYISLSSDNTFLTISEQMVTPFTINSSITDDISIPNRAGRVNVYKQNSDTAQVTKSESFQLLMNSLKENMTSGTLSIFDPLPITISKDGTHMAISSHLGSVVGGIPGPIGVNTSTDDIRSWIQVYEFQNSNTSWVKKGSIITNSNPDYFLGEHMDFSSNGSRLIVSATSRPGVDYSRETITPTILIYEYIGGVWDQRDQRIEDNTTSTSGSITGVAISDDGNRIAFSDLSSNGFEKIEFVVLLEYEEGYYDSLPGDGQILIPEIFRDNGYMFNLFGTGDYLESYMRVIRLHGSGKGHWKFSHVETYLSDSSTFVGAAYHDNDPKEHRIISGLQFNGNDTLIVELYDTMNGNFFDELETPIMQNYTTPPTVYNARRYPSILRRNATTFNPPSVTNYSSNTTPNKLLNPETGWMRVDMLVNNKLTPSRHGEVPYSVDFSDDMTRVVFGIPQANDHLGKVQIFDLVLNSLTQTINGIPVDTHKFVATQVGSDIHGLQVKERFGENVSISGNGSRIAIGNRPYFLDTRDRVTNQWYQYAPANSIDTPSETRIYVYNYEALSSSWSRIISKSLSPILPAPWTTTGLERYNYYQFHVVKTFAYSFFNILSARGRFNYSFDTSIDVGQGYVSNEKVIWQESRSRVSKVKITNDGLKLLVSVFNEIFIYDIESSGATGSWSSHGNTIEVDDVTQFATSHSSISEDGTKVIIPAQSHANAGGTVNTTSRFYICDYDQYTGLWTSSKHHDVEDTTENITGTSGLITGSDKSIFNTIMSSDATRVGSVYFGLPSLAAQGNVTRYPVFRQHIIGSISTGTSWVKRGADISIISPTLHTIEEFRTETFQGSWISPDPSTGNVVTQANINIPQVPIFTGEPSKLKITVNMTLDAVNVSGAYVNLVVNVSTNGSGWGEDFIIFIDSSGSGVYSDNVSVDGNGKVIIQNLVLETDIFDTVSLNTALSLVLTISNEYSVNETINIHLECEYPLINDGDGHTYAKKVITPSVSLSNDGNKVAVGLANDNSRGSVRVFNYAGSWSQVAAINNTTIDGKFGDQVVMTRDGNSLAVSAPGNNNGLGEVFLYDTSTNTPTTKANTLQNTSALSNSTFGHSLGLNDDCTRLFIGDPNYSTDPLIPNYDTGRIVIKEYDSTIDPSSSLPLGFSMGAEIQLTRGGTLLGDSGSNVRFGESIDVSGDGTKIIASRFGDFAYSTAENQYNTDGLEVAEIWNRDSQTGDWSKTNLSRILLGAEINYPAGIAGYKQYKSPNVKISDSGDYYLYGMSSLLGGEYENYTSNVNVASSSLYFTPLPTLVGASSIEIVQNAPYIEFGITLDKPNGTLVITSDVDTKVIGVYTVTYTVTRFGISNFIQRIVNVISSNLPPTITLIGDSNVSITQPVAYTEPDPPVTYTGGALETYGSPPDGSTSGTFTMRYVVRNTLGTVSVQRTITISPDTTPPVITPWGGDITHKFNTGYNDPSYVGSDGNEAVIVTTPSYALTISKIPLYRGTNHITYSATDQAGNIGTFVRNVDVKDDMEATTIQQQLDDSYYSTISNDGSRQAIIRKATNDVVIYGVPTSFVQGWGYFGSMEGQMVKLSSNGQIIAFTTLEGVRVYAYDFGVWVERPAAVNRFSEPGSSMYHMELSKDGNTIAVSYPGGNAQYLEEVVIFRWNSTQYVEDHSVANGSAVVTGLGDTMSLSSDGNRIALGSSKFGGGSMVVSTISSTIYSFATPSPTLDGVQNWYDRTERGYKLTSYGVGGANNTMFWPVTLGSSWSVSWEWYIYGPRWGGADDMRLIYFATTASVHNGYNNFYEFWEGDTHQIRDNNDVYKKSANVYYPLFRWLNVEVSYDSGVMTSTVKHGTRVISSITHDFGNVHQNLYEAQTYFGFSGRTGGVSSTQYIRNINLKTLQEKTGEIEVYDRNGANNWSQVGLNIFGGLENQGLGKNVKLSGDGSTLLNQNEGLDAKGQTVSVFTLNEGIWTKNNTLIDNLITRTLLTGNIDISDDGSLLIYAKGTGSEKYVSHPSGLSTKYIDGYKLESGVYKHSLTIPESSSSPTKLVQVTGDGSTILIHTDDGVVLHSVTDTVFNPVITLTHQDDSDSLRVYIYTEQGATSNVTDGSSVVVGGDAVTNEAGRYRVRYSVTDSNTGKSAHRTRTVTIIL